MGFHMMVPHSRPVIDREDIKAVTAVLASGYVSLLPGEEAVSALSVINNFFLGQDMIATGLGIAGYGTKKGEVRRDERAMRGASSLGKQVSELIKRIKS